jgi:hypothetical protein
VDGPAKENRVLGNNADSGSPRLGDEFVDGFVIERDCTSSGVVESEQEQLDRGFTATTSAAIDEPQLTIDLHQGYAFSLVYPQV